MKTTQRVYDGLFCYETCRCDSVDSVLKYFVIEFFGNVECSSQVAGEMCGWCQNHMQNKCVQDSSTETCSAAPLNSQILFRLHLLSTNQICKQAKTGVCADNMKIQLINIKVRKLNSCLPACKLQMELICTLSVPEVI